MSFQIYTCIITCSLNIFCCPPHEQVTEIVEPMHNATSAVIFLHGTGQSGSIMRASIESEIGSLSQFPNTRFVFPTAAAISFDPFPWSGQIVNVWYNGEAIKPDTWEDAEGMDLSAAELMKWVENQERLGIPHNRTCIVGFSAGGFMALHFAYDYLKDVACVGAVSAFLSSKSSLYKKLNGDRNELEKNLPPLYMASGGLDLVVYPSWTENTVEVFKNGGVQVTYDKVWGQGHYLTKEVLQGLFQFISVYISGI